MVKLLVGIFIVLFTTYYGMIFSRKYKIRKAFFEDLYSFHFSVLEALSFSKRPFEEFYAKQKYRNEFSEVLQDEYNRRQQRKTLPLSLDEYTFLTIDEKGMIADYLCTIGSSDALSQKGYFSRAENTIQSLKNQSIDECKKYVDLYIKMGFLLGLALLIILI